MKRTQQHKLYASEDTVSHGRSFSSVPEVTRWVNELRDRWWWFRFYPTVHLVEVNRSRTPSASVGAWYPDEHLAVIAMLPIHMNEHHILHELAHPLAQARFGSRSHDPYFARVLLELTFLVRGQDAWSELANAFIRDGIVVDKTPEENRLYSSIAETPA